MADEQHYLYTLSAYGTEEFYPMDGATTNPFKLRVNEDYEEITVTPGDYVSNVTYWDEDPYVLDATYTPLYVYTTNNEWKYVGAASDDYLGNSIGCNYFDNSGADIKLDEGDGSFVEGSTCNRVILSPQQEQTSFYKVYLNSNHRYAAYGYYEDHYDELISETITIEVNFGDYYVDESFNHWWYQYPGVWVKNIYPDFNAPMPAPKYKGHVQLKWTDPPDITDWKPTPATWEGTVIVRKENSAPLHRWDGDKVVRTTTRDKYKSKPYKDEDIETNKVYYYAFMPYYTKIDDPQHPIRYYTFTKCIRVETGTISYIPEIIKIDMNEDVATITYAITLPATGPYDTAKLYGKKDDNPVCDNTDDIVEDISQVDDQIVVPDIDGDYYFCIQVANGTDTLTSDVVSCYGESIIPAYLQEVGSYLIGRADNKQSLLTCSMWQNGSYIGRNGWTLPMCLYHPDTNINSDYINLASFPDGATINIDTSNGINVTYTGFTASRMFFQYGYARARIGMSWEAKGAPEGSYWAGYESGNDSNYEPTKNDFTSLEDLFEYIYQHFRHVNVIFNGETVVTETIES